jgi:hypothetical protein
MSAWKPIVLFLVICGTIAGTVHADAISWPSGLDNWVVYLAAPTGTPGTGPLSYTSQQSTPAQVQATPVATSPAPIQTAFVAPDASSQSVATQAATNTNSSSPPAQIQTAASSVPLPEMPSDRTPSAPVQPPSYTAPVSSSPSTYTPGTSLPPSSYTPPTSSPPSTVQPLTYIHPASSQLSSVQPMRYTPPTVLSNVPQSSSHPAAMTPNLSVVSSASVSASAPVHAFINVGNGPYALAAAITSGGAQPWYSSTQLTSFFGGQPTAQQIQSFDNTVLQRVQQTFSQSGVSVSLTENPNVAALHTISLVSNTASSTLSSAIGMTQVGSNGFSFIDQIAHSAQSLEQLEWIVAHNISHELMLAFGVPESYDTTGKFIDSKLASWAMMVNPDSTFSSAAAQAINQALASQVQPVSTGLLGAQEVNPSPPPIPEPATLAIWGLAAAALVISRRLRAGRVWLARTV